jgi:hypothetical protein
MRPREVLKQVRDLTVSLVELGLCDEQNFPVLRPLGDGREELTISGSADLSAAMKNIDYRQIYG